jgi:hypothetical protein
VYGIALDPRELAEIRSAVAVVSPAHDGGKSAEFCGFDVDRALEICESNDAELQRQLFDVRAELAELRALVIGRSETAEFQP